MAKANWNQYSATAASNTDINSIDIDEGMAPSNVNNAIRELMAHTADVVAGTVALSSINIDGGNIDGVTIGSLAADLAVADGGTGSSTAAGARTNLGLGTSATIDVGTSASQVVQLNGSAELPAVSGANLTNLPVTDVSSDVRFLALQVASDRIGLEDGIADPFADETDIDTSTSTNESFNSSGTFYSPSLSVGSAEDLSSKTYFGNMTGGGGLAAGFDGTTSQAYASSASSSSNPGTLGVALGSGNGFVLTQAKVYAPSDTGMNAPNGIKIYGNSSASASGGTLLHTGSIGSGTAATATFTIDNSTSYENYYAEFLYDSGTVYCAELELFAGTTQNMTLVSNAFTADSAPASAIIGVQTVESDTITINTDLTAEVSRDGGTNFTSCTLVLQNTLGATGTKYYESASTDISSQPSGTSVKYRIKTLNNKSVEIHGVTVKWAT